MNNDNRITVPLTPQLLNWVRNTSTHLNVSCSKLVREILETISKQYEAPNENL